MGNTAGMISFVSDHAWVKWMVSILLVTAKLMCELRCNVCCAQETGAISQCIYFVLQSGNSLQYPKVSQNVVQSNANPWELPTKLVEQKNISFNQPIKDIVRIVVMPITLFWLGHQVHISCNQPVKSSVRTCLKAVVLSQKQC